MGVSYVNAGVSISKLFCDKFTFTINYKTPAEKQHVLKAIKELKGYKTMYAGTFSKQSYKQGIFVCPDENVLSERLLILADPKSPEKSFLRVAYNPARIDMAGCYGILHELLPGRVADIRDRASCTRFDATVDVKGITPDKLLAHYPHMQVSRSFRKSGHCETLDLGRYDGDRRAVVYDKVAKIKRWNENHMIKQPVPTTATTRIEIVMRPGLVYDGMANISNPFAPLSISTFVALKGTETELCMETELFRMFIAAAQVHGANDMLAILGESQRKKYKKILDQSACPWWQPEKLWGQWPQLLDRTFSVA